MLNVRVVSPEERQRELAHEEAELLLTRMVSDLARLNRTIQEFCAASLDKERMARDPYCVSDNLSGAMSPLFFHDIERIRAAVRLLAKR